MASTYEVRVTIEVLNHTVKSHRNGHFTKRYEFTAGKFGDGTPNAADRDQAKELASTVVNTIRVTSKTANIYAKE